MATCRQRGDRWEFSIRRKGLLPKPLWFSFPSRVEGEAYCARIERLLDAGIVPDEANRERFKTISQAHELYVKMNPVSQSDLAYWNVILKRWGSTPLVAVGYSWVEDMVTKCKETMAPSTIRHQVGALSRMWDWFLKKQIVATNPFKSLRRGYASGGAKEDRQRDRRLSREEEVRLIAELDGELLLLFLLALETAMRMREMYTLTTDQIDVSRKTIFLDKTKNGDKRQVPLSSVACELLRNPVTYHLVPKIWNGTGTLSQATSRVSVAWGRVTRKLGILDLHFHDLRHEATSRLFERTTLSDLMIAKITGHRDPRMLMRYANLRGSTLADSLW